MNSSPCVDSRFPVALLWHMHQPEYRVEGRFHLPWVYLHGISSYSDMASHLEAIDGACAVVNFSPVLLDQLQDYTQRLAKTRRDRSVAVGDALLDALHFLPPIGPGRAQLVRRCLPVHPNRRTDRHPEFRAVIERARAGAPESIDDATLSDLIVWFHLSWLGESLRGDERAQRLYAQGRDYSPQLRGELVDLIADALAGLIPRYRALWDTGRVELSMTPYYHPLIPLLIDFGSGADNAPGATLPARAYPEGEERSRWHLREGRHRFAELFGREPAGCWPSEAALSEPTMSLLDELGFTWAASSQSVLSSTQAHAGRHDGEPFHAWRRDGQRLLAYFRDDGLSDRIGFAYKDWHADDAVADLARTLEHIADSGQRNLVLIALDGENAWEYYADNGIHFLRGMYRRLATHPRLRLATLSQCTAEQSARARSLAPVRAGSWVHGQLLTWVGHSEKNRAWAMLMDARAHYLAQPLPSAAASAALGASEGSDWFWWPGASNPADSVSDFDALFRAHLSALYRALGETPPEELSRPFAEGRDGPVAAGGTMQATAPVLAPWIARSAGVLLDVRALPSASIGADALRFATLAADAGLRVWQLLPVGPRDAHHNPFQPASAYAGDTTLLHDVVSAEDESALRDFCERERDWLDDWAMFHALKAESPDLAWWQWPPDLRDREPQALAEVRQRLAAAIGREQGLQWRFETAWAGFKKSANALGLLLFGDVPLFVAHDSADVWSQRQLFEIDAAGQCAAVVGVPPDLFSEEGQRWGYPAYRWAAMAAEKFRWWTRRFEVQSRRFDLVRLDHFRGLAAWWRIPAEAANATEGAWIAGPGAAAIEALRPVLGGARLVAEDLGVITDDVIALRTSQGIPGMRILQFGFDGDPANPHLPVNHAPDSLCYTGTHDNDTTLGWWRGLPEDVQMRIGKQFPGGAPTMPDALLDWAWSSPAPLAIAPLQDLLGLGTEARTNVPGVADGNWRWQFAWAALPADFAARLRDTLSGHGRATQRP